MSGTSTTSSIDSPLSSSVTHSLFHSRLKTFLFCKSSPPQRIRGFAIMRYINLLLTLALTMTQPSFSSSGLTDSTDQFTDSSEHIRFLLLSFSVFHFLVVGSVR